MSVRVIVTLHLPLDMGAVGRILRAVSTAYPDAVISDGSTTGGNFAVAADDDPMLTTADRRRIARERRVR